MAPTIADTVDHVNLHGMPKLSPAGGGVLSILLRRRRVVYSRSPVYGSATSVNLLPLFHEFPFPQALFESPTMRSEYLLDVFSRVGLGLNARFYLAPRVEEFLSGLVHGAVTTSFGAALGFEALVEIGMTTMEVYEDLHYDYDEEEEEAEEEERGASWAEIQRMKTGRYGSDGGGSGGDESKRECAICLEEFSGGVEYTELPCSHIFHYECAVRWLLKDRSCPLCRNRRLT